MKSRAEKPEDSHLLASFLYSVPHVSPVPRLPGAPHVLQHCTLTYLAQQYHV